MINLCSSPTSSRVVSSESSGVLESSFGRWRKLPRLSAIQNSKKSSRRLRRCLNDPIPLFSVRHCICNTNIIIIAQWDDEIKYASEQTSARQHFDCRLPVFFRWWSNLLALLFSRDVTMCKVIGYKLNLYMDRYPTNFFELQHLESKKL